MNLRLIKHSRIIMILLAFGCTADSSVMAEPELKISLPKNIKQPNRQILGDFGLHPYPPGSGQMANGLLTVRKMQFFLRASIVISVMVLLVEWVKSECPKVGDILTIRGSHSAFPDTSENDL